MARRTQQQKLVSLFAADGMTLDPALIPTDTAVSTYALIRDETAERKAATFLLGDNLERTTQGGGIYTYTSQQGAAAFRDTGSFERRRFSVTGERGSILSGFLQGIFLRYADIYAG